MTTNEIISLIDLEISKLQQVRSLLGEYSDPTPAVTKRGPGRPEKGTSEPTVKRVMSAEARARIASAQKKRWAAQRKAAK